MVYNCMVILSQELVYWYRQIVYWYRQIKLYEALTAVGCDHMASKEGCEAPTV